MHPAAMAVLLLLSAAAAAAAAAVAPPSCLQPPCPHDEPALYKGYGAAVLVNPLKKLPPLPKYHHMSGDYVLYTYNASFNDDLMFDLTRITGAAPLELGYYNGKGGNPEGDAKVKLRVEGVVAACARVNALAGREAVISMNCAFHCLPLVELLALMVHCRGSVAVEVHSADRPILHTARGGRAGVLREPSRDVQPADCASQQRIEIESSHRGHRDRLRTVCLEGLSRRYPRCGLLGGANA